METSEVENALCWSEKMSIVRASNCFILPRICWYSEGGIRSLSAKACCPPSHPYAVGQKVTWGNRAKVTDLADSFWESLQTT